MKFARLNSRRRWIVAAASALALGAASIGVVMFFVSGEHEEEVGLYGFLERPRAVPSPQPTVGLDPVATAVVEGSASKIPHFDQPGGELWWDAPPKGAHWRLVASMGADPDRVVDPDVDPDRAVDPDKPMTEAEKEADGLDPELLPGAFVAPQAVFSLSDGRCDGAPALRQRYGIPQIIAVEDARWFFPVRAVLRDQSWFNTGFGHDGWQLFQADDPDTAYLVYGPDPNFAIEYRTYLCPAPA